MLFRLLISFRFFLCAALVALLLLFGGLATTAAAPVASPTVTEGGLVCLTITVPAYDPAVPMTTCDALCADHHAACVNFTSLISSPMSAGNARGQAIYAKLRPETKAVTFKGNQHTGVVSENSAFTTATAETIGKSRRSVEVAAARGEALGDDLHGAAGTSRCGAGSAQTERLRPCTDELRRGWQSLHVHVASRMPQ